jgi:hypothetical protein
MENFDSGAIDQNLISSTRLRQIMIWFFETEDHGSKIWIDAERGESTELTLKWTKRLPCNIIL